MNVEADRGPRLWWSLLVSVGDVSLEASAAASPSPWWPLTVWICEACSYFSKSQVRKSLACPLDPFAVIWKEVVTMSKMQVDFWLNTTDATHFYSLSKVK